MAKGNNRRKKSGGWWWLIFVVIALLAQAGENVDLRRAWLRFRVNMLRSGIDVQRIAPIVIGVVVLVIVVSIVSAAAKRRAEAGSGAVRSSTAGRTSAAVQRRDPRTGSFTQPDAYCVVCDHSGEDHFQHDRSQRIKQLDEWLRNGLIDRSEYKVLLDRYKRDL